MFFSSKIRSYIYIFDGYIFVIKDERRQGAQPRQRKNMYRQDNDARLQQGRSGEVSHEKTRNDTRSAARRESHRPNTAATTTAEFEGGRSLPVSAFSTVEDELGSITFDFEAPLAVMDWKWPGQRTHNGYICTHYLSNLCFAQMSTGEQCPWAHNLETLPMWRDRDIELYKRIESIVCGVPNQK